MKTNLVQLYIVIMMICCPILWADDQGSEILVQNFITALSNDDQTEIAQTWYALRINPEAKDYMEQKHPWAASAYRSTEAALQAPGYLENFRKNYTPSPFGQEFIPTALDTIPLLTNRDEVLLYPNEDQPSNQQYVRQQQNAPFVDNKEQVFNHPNQNEQSNQDIINNRLERMFVTGQ